MATQKQTFRNNSSRDIEIYVEPWPSRYVLRANDELTLEAEVPEENIEPFSVNVAEHGLQIYPGACETIGTWINGKPVPQNGHSLA